MFVQSKELTKSLLISLMILRVETAPKSSSIGGRKISPQSYKTIADTKAWVVPQFGIATMRYCELKLPANERKILC